MAYQSPRHRGAPVRSPRSPRMECVPPWAESQVMRSARPSSAQTKEKVVHDFFRRVESHLQDTYGTSMYPPSSPRDRTRPVDQYTWWRLHAAKTNVKQAKEMSPRPLSARATLLPTRPTSARPFGQPSLPAPGSPRSPRGSPRGSPRPVSAFGARYAPPSDYTQRIARANFPGFKPPVANPIIKQATETPWWKQPLPTEEAPAAAAPVAEQPKRRGWGELPPGVTPDDLRSAAAAIKEKLIDKFGSLTKAFRAMDKDASGTVTLEELENYLVVINLNAIRKDVVRALFETIDADESESFDFKEFSRVMSSGDVMKMAKIEDKFDGHEAKRLEAEAQQRAFEEARAKQVGMTVEEYNEYYKGNKMVMGASTEDQQFVQYDKWGKKLAKSNKEANEASNKKAAAALAQYQ